MEIYHKRLKKIQDRLKGSCEAFLVDDKINLYYLTGLDLSAGKLIIDSKGANLCVDGRYFELCKEKSPFPVHLNHAETTFQTLGFNSVTTTYKSYEELKKTYPEVSLIPIDSLVEKERAIKDSFEIDLMRKAAKLGFEGFEYVASLLQEGISELQLAIELEIFWKKRGGKGVAFDPIIAFGPNSSMPHYRAGNTRLKKGQNVLIDIGVNLNHYNSDLTRVIFFGDPDPRIQNIYKVVDEARQKAFALCKPGISLGEVDAAARDHIISQGFGDYFTHSLGHGVGLEVHEYPSFRNKETILQSGMVLTIEPGIYLPQVGGVRLEDTLLITDSGFENLV